MLVPINEPGIGEVARAAFPANRKPIKVEEFKGPVIVNSYWDGGSRDEYRLIDLTTGRVASIPESHPAYNRTDDGTPCGRLELRELPPNCALVAGGTFCGKPATVRVMLRPENLVKLLPAPKPDLPPESVKALDVICGIKGSYRQAEFERYGLGDYGPTNRAVVALAERGLVTINKAGAIAATIEGKNARVRS